MTTPAIYRIAEKAPVFPCEMQNAEHGWEVYRFAPALKSDYADYGFTLWRPLTAPEPSERGEDITNEPLEGDECGPIHADRGLREQATATDLNDPRRVQSVDTKAVANVNDISTPSATGTPADDNAMAAKPSDNRVCHAAGERCHGCPHYYGRAAVCSYAPTPASGNLQEAEASSKILCPHCGSPVLWSEDRGAHCDGCDDFDPEKDVTTAPAKEGTGTPRTVRSRSDWQVPRGDFRPYELVHPAYVETLERELQEAKAACLRGHKAANERHREVCAELSAQLTAAHAEVERLRASASDSNKLLLAGGYELGEAADHIAKQNGTIAALTAERDGLQLESDAAHAQLRQHVNWLKVSEAEAKNLRADLEAAKADGERALRILNSVSVVLNDRKALSKDALHGEATRRYNEILVLMIPFMDARAATKNEGEETK